MKKLIKIDFSKIDFSTIYGMSKRLLKKAEVARQLDCFEDAANLIKRIDDLYNLYERHVMRCSHIEDKDKLIEESQEAMRGIFESDTYVDIARDVYEYGS